jgi:hypothetical protein
MNPIPWKIIHQGFGPIIVDANEEIVARVDWGRGKNDEENAQAIIDGVNNQNEG